MREKDRGRKKLPKTFISNVELIEKRDLGLWWPSPTHIGSIYHHEKMISFPGLSTRSKPNRGTKNGPCHSLSGIHVLCPRSCFSLSHFSPFFPFFIAHWIWSSHRLVAFRRVQLLPSAKQLLDQHIKSDLFL